MDEHWFDALNKMLLRGNVPRRVMLRAAAIASASHALGTVSFTAAARKKKRPKNGKGNGKGKGKGKGKKRKVKHKRPPPAPPCSGGLCTQTWPGNDSYSRDQRDYCEFICEQCDGDDPREFCMIAGDIASCCNEGFTCCEIGICADLLNDDDNCGACNNTCSLGRFCFGGVCECRAGLTECGGICRDTLRDEDHCGGCDVACEEDELCCNGGCTDVMFDNSHCGSCNWACPTGIECCHGHWIDPQRHVCCLDNTRSWPICNLPSVCCGTPENPGCCLAP